MDLLAPKVTAMIVAPCEEGQAEVINALNDFLLRVKEVYPKLAIPPDAGNAVEIMKNRDLGVVDEMILMFFDRTCKTMTDVRGGVPAYGWTEKCTAVDPADIPDFPF